MDSNHRHEVQEQRRGYAERWESILSRPVRQIAQAITADTPEARDLRQNSPSAGLLSEAERRKILQEVR